MGEAIIGGLIAGCFALVGVHFSFRNQLKRDQLDREQRTKSFLLSIADEVSVVWGSIEGDVGKSIEAIKDDNYLDLIYPNEQAYFQVYDSNVPYLGDVADSELRKLIIVTYHHLKGLIDTFNSNNVSVDEYRKLKSGVNARSALERTQVIEAKTRLIQYAQQVRAHYFETKKYVESLLPQICSTTKQENP